jgi:hypothetical protein
MLKNRRDAALVAAATATFLTLASPGTVSAQESTMKRMTPVILVDEVEPCLDIWKKIGFEQTMEVPEGDRLGFVALQNGPVEIMYQARTSMGGDLPFLAELDYTRDGLLLFIEVESLADVKKRLEGVEGVVELLAERETFYGSREIAIQTPCGTRAVFAEFPQGDDSGD